MLELIPGIEQDRFVTDILKRVHEEVGHYKGLSVEVNFGEYVNLRFRFGKLGYECKLDKKDVARHSDIISTAVSFSMQYFSKKSCTNHTEVL